MGKDKKIKKKCCGKFIKKGKHCSSCPVTSGSNKCKQDKSYCDDCSMNTGDKRRKKTKKNGSSKKKKSTR